MCHSTTNGSDHQRYIPHNIKYYKTGYCQNCCRWSWKCL